MISFNDFDFLQKTITHLHPWFSNCKTICPQNDHFTRPRLRVPHTISHKSTSKASPPLEASGSQEIMEVNMTRWSINLRTQLLLRYYNAIIYHITKQIHIRHRFKMYVAITIMTSLYQFFLPWAVVTHCTLVNAGWWWAPSFHLSEKHQGTQDVCAKLWKNRSP